MPLNACFDQFNIHSLSKMLSDFITYSFLSKVCCWFIQYESICNKKHQIWDFLLQGEKYTIQLISICTQNEPCVPSADPANKAIHFHLSVVRLVGDSRPRGGTEREGWANTHCTGCTNLAGNMNMGTWTLVRSSRIFCHATCLTVVSWYRIIRILSWANKISCFARSA